MAAKKSNNYVSKIKRTCTSILPVSKKRKGKCINCGKCCQLPTPCLFLKFRPDGTAYCSVYQVRPLNCRKYPRSEKEFLTSENCGYWFE